MEVAYPNVRNEPMPYDQLECRYALLLRAMRWGACLTVTEAVNCLQCLQLRCGGGEAVQHYGGPVAVLRGAIRCRHYVREMYAKAKAEREKAVAAA